MDPLFEGPADRMHARLVLFFFNRGQGQAQGSVGNQLMLLGHGVDRQRQKIQQLGVTKGAQAQRARLEWEVMQRVKHTLQEHVGRGHQCVRQMPQSLQ